MNIKHNALLLTLVCVAISMKAAENRQATKDGQNSPFFIFVRNPDDQLISRINAVQETSTPAAPSIIAQPNRLRNSQSPVRQQPIEPGSPRALREQAARNSLRGRCVSPSSLRNVSYPNPDANPDSQTE